MSQTARTLSQIKAVTAQIRQHEARVGQWDGDKLDRAYARRGRLCLKALGLGVSAEHLSSITGLGA